METDKLPNPYQSPSSVANAADIPDSRSPLLRLLGVAVIAGGLSLALPAFAVPLSFLLAPAFVRAWRLRQLDAGDETKWFGVLVISSFLYAIPSAIASGIAFCCVCFPSAYVGSWFTIVGREVNYFVLIVGGSLLLVASTFIGLWVGDYVLRRNRFFIKPQPIEPHSDTNTNTELDRSSASE